MESIINANTKQLQSIHVENIDWDNFNVEALAWLADRPTCELYGRIGIAEGTNEYQTAVTWDMKNKFIKKFGDVDSGNGNLTLEYRKRNFEANTAKIKGQFFVDDYIVRDGGYNDVETFDFSVAPESNYMNTQTKIQFSLEGGNTSAYSMSANGKLSVNVYQLSDKQNFATIKAAITQYENGSFVTENVTKKIEIWNRPAQVGDVVYYDGSYGSAEEYVEGIKTPVGVCFYVAPRNADGSINATFHNPSDKMKRFMIALKDMTLSSDTENFNMFALGAMCRASFNVEESLYYVDEFGNKHHLSIDGGITTIYDIPTIDNIVTQGAYSSEFNDENHIPTNVVEDLSDDGIKNNGFKAYPANTALGDGFAYEEDNKSLKDRTLNESIIGLASEIYSSGDIVNSGYAKTLKIIEYRNRILRTGFNEIGLYPDTKHFHVPSNENELYELANCLSEIKKWASSSDGISDTYYEKWTQLYYPAASLCYAFQPTVDKSESLSTKFKSHNWFLPPAGLMTRIVYYFFDLSQNGMKDKINSPIRASMEKGVLLRLERYYHSTTEKDNVDSYGFDIWFRVCAGRAKGAAYFVRPICAF